MASQILVLEDSEISDSDSVVLPPRRRGKSEPYNWAKIRAYPNKSAAIADLKLQNIFWKHSTYSTEEGETIRFNCTYSRSCAAKVYILCESTSQRCILFKMDKAHIHKKKAVGISPTIKTKIKELYRSEETDLAFIHGVSKVSNSIVVSYNW